MRKALFICRQGKHRSRTAAEIFATWTNCETKWAGSDKDALFPLLVEDIGWATIIFTMEKSQEKKMKKSFPGALAGKRVICLNIPDEFQYGDEHLKRILETKAGTYLAIK